MPAADERGIMEYSQKERIIAKWLTWLWTAIYLTLFPFALYGAFFGGAFALGYPGGRQFYVAEVVLSLMLTVPASMLFTVYCMWLKISEKKYRSIHYLWMIPFGVGILAILAYLIFMECTGL